MFLQRPATAPDNLNKDALWAINLKHVIGMRIMRVKAGEDRRKLLFLLSNGPDSYRSWHFESLADADRCLQNAIEKLESSK